MAQLILFIFVSGKKISQGDLLSALVHTLYKTMYNIRKL